MFKLNVNIAIINFYDLILERFNKEYITNILSIIK